MIATMVTIARTPNTISAPKSTPRRQALEDLERQARHDAAEDDDRHALADAVLGDQLAHPDQQHGARGHRDDDGQRAQRVRSKPKFLMIGVLPPELKLIRFGVPYAWNMRQRHGQPVRPLVDLLPPRSRLLWRSPAAWGWPAA